MAIDLKSSLTWRGSTWTYKATVEPVEGRVRLRGCDGPCGMPASQDELRNGLAAAIKAHAIHAVATEIGRREDVVDAKVDRRWVPGSDVLFNACQDVGDLIGRELADAFHGKLQVSEAEVASIFDLVEQVRSRLAEIENGMRSYFAAATVEEPFKKATEEEAKAFKDQYGIELNDLPF